MTHDDRVQTLGGAIRDALGDRSGSWLARELDVDPSYVSRILSGQIPGVSLTQVARIEDALGCRRGELLRAAGYVADDVTVEDAIRQDPALRPNARRALLGAYRALTEVEANGDG